MGIDKRKQTKMAVKLRKIGGEEIQTAPLEIAEKGVKNEGILIFAECKDIGTSVKKSGGGAAVEYNTLSYILTKFKMTDKGRDHLQSLANKRQKSAGKPAPKLAKAATKKNKTPKKGGKTVASKAVGGAKKTTTKVAAGAKNLAKKAGGLFKGLGKKVTGKKSPAKTKTSKKASKKVRK